MMIIKLEATVYPKDIAKEYKHDTIDTDFYGCGYPLEDYVREALYDEYYCEVRIPDEEIKKVTEKVQKELDKLLQN